MKKIVKCEVVPGPAYELPPHWEDGSVVTTWDLLIVATTADGLEYTRSRTFDRDEPEKAANTAEFVERMGYIDTEMWLEGSPWDKYRVSQTWDEERAEALERER